MMRKCDEPVTRLKKRYVDGPYGQMHLRVAEPETGQVCALKRPLVCFHMFPQSSRNFEVFMQFASLDRRVIAIDCPGYGESCAPKEPVSIENYANAFWCALDALNVCASHGSLDIFGVHAGAKVAVEVMHQRPDSINRAALSSPAVMCADEVERLRGVFGIVPLDEEGSRFQHFWKMLVSGRKPEVTLEMCSVGLSEMLRGGETYAWGPFAIFDYNLKFADVLTKLPHPVAVLNPGDELYDYTPRCLEYLKHAELFDLPDWSHGYLDIHAESAAELVTSWLDNHNLALMRSPRIAV